MLLKNKRKYKGRVNSSFRLDPDIREALNKAARLDKEGRTISDLVNEALRNYPVIMQYLNPSK